MHPRKESFKEGRNSGIRCLGVYYFGIKIIKNLSIMFLINRISGKPVYRVLKETTHYMSLKPFRPL
jgi:hypothetical protein